MAKSRQAVVNLVKSWEGKKESNGSHKSIIDLYNDFFEKICAGKFPRGIRMRYDWAWCACTWSALAAALRYESIMPMEISCYYLIEAAKKMGCWQENDAYVPSPGDAILYDWQDNGFGDNSGNPDHVGTVIEVHKESGYMVIEEGNYSNAVKKRTLSINGKFIRGFITPKYDYNTVAAPGLSKGKDIKTIAHEVIVGLWGSGENRKKLLTEYGYSYSEVQNMVNQILNGSAVTPSNTKQDQNQSVSKKVVATCSAKQFNKTCAGEYKTTAVLYCRNDAGTNKKAICKIPAGTKVKCYGYYTMANGVKWLYIQFVLDGVQYTGFSSSAYLAK